MPVYNGEGFVADSLQAILEQDYPNLEVIVSDNGSTDRTPHIVRAFAERDARIRLFLQRENRGAAWNFNYVYHQSRGQFFKWAAHDDLCEPSFIRKCVAALQENPDAVLAYPRSCIIDERGQVVRDYPSWGFGCDAERIARVKSMLKRRSACFEICGVIRTQALAATRMLGTYASADRVLCLELGIVGRFVELDERLFFYRKHLGQSVAKHQDPRHRSRWFNANVETGCAFPYWRVLWELIGAIRHNWPSEQRRRAYLILTTWLRRHAWMLAREIPRGMLVKLKGGHDSRIATAAGKSLRSS